MSLYIAFALGVFIGIVVGMCISALFAHTDEADGGRQ